MQGMMMIELRIENVDENVSSIFEVPDFLLLYCATYLVGSRFLWWSHRCLHNRLAQLAVLHAVCYIRERKSIGVSLERFPKVVGAVICLVPISLVRKKEFMCAEVDDITLGKRPNFGEVCKTLKSLSLSLCLSLSLSLSLWRTCGFDRWRLLIISAHLNSFCEMVGL
jgi:hypothetical protein